MALRLYLISSSTTYIDIELITWGWCVANHSFNTSNTTVSYTASFYFIVCRTRDTKPKVHLTHSNLPHMRSFVRLGQIVNHAELHSLANAELGACVSHDQDTTTSSASRLKL
ncbi:hypothetical protein FCULG_00002106 [Fusarium culmorum]|uniref:Uncharacterized protein n=1 Tax=Fusarium culmorum TaxID=5516 RepID=A0A2T4GR95_FUSCU|nr:hypothetical protein FCULG_00002106 [Fusarium culmorum]